MAISKIKTGSITDDAVTAAKVDDDGTGYTVGDLTSTGAITLGSGGTNWSLPTARGTDKYVLQINGSTGAATWEESLTAPELSSVSNMKINQYETPYSYTGNTTDTSTTISNLSSDTGILVGQYISGAGIPSNTTISSITNSTTIVISNAATATGTGTTLSIQKTPGEKNGGSVTITGTNFGTIITDLSVAITTSGGGIIANASFLTSLSNGTSITAEWLGTEGTYNEHLNSAHGSYIGDSGNIYLKITKSGLASNVLNSSTTLTADPTLPNSGVPTQTGGDVTTAPTASSLGVYGGTSSGGSTDTNTKVFMNFDRGGGSDFEDSSNIDNSGAGWIKNGGTKINASPFGDAKSAMWFDGSDDVCKISNHDDFDMGTGAFTIECWVRPSDPGNGADCIMTRTVNSSTVLWFWRITSSKAIEFSLNNTSGSDHDTGASWTFVQDVWVHLAVTRDSSGYVRMFADGTNIYTSSAADTGDYSSDGEWWIGANPTGSQNYHGYIDEIRYVKGVAVYTGDFIVPKSRLSTTQSAGTNIAAITGTATKLLIHSNQQIDSIDRENRHVVSTYGDGVYQRQNTTARNSVAATAWNSSAWFFGGGTGDTLYVADSSDWDLEASDFTLECWVYPTSTEAVWVVGQLSGGSASSPWGIGLTSSNQIKFRRRTSGGSYEDQLTAGTLSANTWYHVAIVRLGTNQKCYLNGTYDNTFNGTWNNTFSTASTPIAIGGGDYNGTHGLFNGYISDIRLTVGTAVYTGNFTPPTGPLTTEWSANPFGGSNTAANTGWDGIKKVKLLILGHDATSAASGARFVDSSSSSRTITHSGGTSGPYHDNDYQGFPAASIPLATSGKQYGASGMYLDGVGDYLVGTIPSIGTGDMTMDFWFMPMDQPGGGDNDRIFIDSRSGGFFLSFNKAAANQWIRFYDAQDTSDDIQWDGATDRLTLQTWYHIALERHSGTIRLFINGTARAKTATSNTSNWNSTNMRIGINQSSSNNDHAFKGQIDNFRISTTARYQGTNFTPPTQIYGKIGPANPNVGTITLSATSTTAIDFSSVGTALPAGLTLAEGTDDGNTRKATITGSFTGTVSSDTSTQNILIKGQDPSDATRAITFNGTTGMGITQNSSGAQVLFNGRRYKGTSADRQITGYGFKPDMVWIKQRTSTENHNIHDSVRGPGKTLDPASNTAEDASTVVPGVAGASFNAFIKDGWDYRNGNGSNRGILNNASSDHTYVAWGWKAGGTPSGELVGSGATMSGTSGAGTIHNSATGVLRATSITQSVNQTSGFSITKFAGHNDGVTFPHNLGGTPAFIMIKNLSQQGWYCWHQNLTATSTYFIALNNDGPQGNDANTFSTAPSSTIITTGSEGGTGGTSSTNYICYAWKVVAGSSAFGSYTGNSNNQTITFANSDTFTPKFLLIKNSVGTHNWLIIDVFRGFGVAGGTASKALFPNANSTEDNQGGCTVGAGTFAWGSNLSGGTLSKVNENGQTYIYCAFG